MASVQPCSSHFLRNAYCYRVIFNSGLCIDLLQMACELQQTGYVVKALVAVETEQGNALIMNLLFITHATLDNPPYGDGSTRYRCFNIAEVAHQAGHNVQVRSAASITPNELCNFDLISWLRPVASRHLFRLLDTARAQGIPCIADLDDLIINPELAEQSPSVVNNFCHVQQLRERFTNHAEAVQAFDAVTVSTEYLHTEVAKVLSCTPIATLHNGLSEYWMRHADAQASATPMVQSLGYLPGTRSHDQDFSSIRLPLQHWLSQHPKRELHIVGKIDIQGASLPLNQVKQKPWVDYFSLPAVILRSSASLAPLTQSVFNHAKSHVKFIESAALGVPLVATPIQDIAQHRIKGLLLANDEAQWIHALELAACKDFRGEHASSLKQYVSNHCTATVYAKPLIDAWNAGLLLPESVPDTELPHAA